MTFLEFFNVSENNLTGPIPQGKQFSTFSNTSFDGNPGLCGTPLSKACRSSKESPPTPSSLEQGSTSEFDWKFVLMGYGSGLVIGVSIGYYLMSWKHEWFVGTFGKRQRKALFDKLLKMFKPLKMEIFNGFNFSICLITKF